MVPRRSDALDQPIALIRRLYTAGVTMRGAHAAVNRLAEMGWVACRVDGTEDLLALARDLAGMSVQLRRRVPAVGTVLDVTELRTRSGLSQREYPELLGPDVSFRIGNMIETIRIPPPSA